MGLIETTRRDKKRENELVRRQGTAQNLGSVPTWEEAEEVGRGWVVRPFKGVFVDWTESVIIGPSSAGVQFPS